MILAEIKPKALLEFYQTGEAQGPTCAVLTPAIKAKLHEIASGEVLEVRVDDPSAEEDIRSWSRLSGHELLVEEKDADQHLRFFLRKK